MTMFPTNAEPVRTPVSADAPARGHNSGSALGGAAPSSTERLRLTALLMLIGALAQLPLALLHPHHEQPNDSRAAFAEYARSTDWVWVHLGQYLGTLLLALGLVTLAASLARQGGLVGQLGRLAAAAAVVTTAVFAVQMAVDGIALKAAVDHWAATSGAAETAAYDVADGIRATEKGLSALFHLNNGITLLSLGVAMVCSRSHRVLGCVGAAAGVGFIVMAGVTARAGFSPEAGTLALAPTLLLLAFLVGAASLMWTGKLHTLARCGRPSK